MPGHKNERTPQVNERNYPHIAEWEVPLGGFGKTLHLIEAFHRERGIEPMRGRYVRRDGRDFVRWCFVDRETAEAFMARFGGTVIDSAKMARR